jgi:DNA modification methylase
MPIPQAAINYNLQMQKNTAANDVIGGSESWSLQLGDSQSLITAIPRSSIDLIFTDPPYNLGAYSTGNIRLDWRADFNNDIADWDLGQFDPANYRDEFLRILKPTGNIMAFTSYNLIGRWHEIFDPLFDTFQFAVWHKTNPPPKFRKAGFLNSCELIVCLWNKGHTWNFSNQRDMHNFYQSPTCAGKERIKDPKHPTQKPTSVLKHFMAMASNPGDVVLDPFAGVMSTGAAAMELERRFIGFEIDENFFRAGKNRLTELARNVTPIK